MSAAIEIETGYASGVIAELRDQIARLERLSEARDLRIADLRRAHNKLLDLVTEAHYQLVELGWTECDRCLGTGGVPLVIEEEWIDENGETRGIVTEWSSPKEEACSDCEGSGIDD